MYFFQKNRPFKHYILLFLICFFSLLHAQVFAQSFLQPEQAFQLNAKQENKEIILNFQISPGYYLYHEKFNFQVKHGDAKLDKATFPIGLEKYDPTFEKNMQVFKGNLLIHLPILSATKPFDLVINWQGCSEQGICYPPEQRVLRFQPLLKQAAGQGADKEINQASVQKTSQSIHMQAMQGSVNSVNRVTKVDSSHSFQIQKYQNPEYIQAFLAKSNFFKIIIFYFLAGLLLSLLPCSYTMLPILAAIIVGDRANAKVTRYRSFLLSLIYVLGMACVYALLGILAVLLGQSLGAWLQNPFMLGFFALLLVVFAGLLISGRDLQLPQRWQQSIDQFAGKQTGGKYIAVALMGALSALVVGACMTAPLFAVLTFIAHTGNMLLGAFALFFMALGLGVPLLIIGLGAGALLPKAGQWMNVVKVMFGVLLIGAALWILWPVLPAWSKMLLVAGWLAFTAFIFKDVLVAKTTFSRSVVHTVIAFLMSWAVLIMVGLAAGQRSPFQPLQGILQPTSLSASTLKQSPLSFESVSTLAELQHVLDNSQRPVLLDFYADWCVSCREMEQFAFSNPHVQKAMQVFHLVRVNLTENNENDHAFLKAFEVFGPPVMVIFNRAGKEHQRIVGYQGIDVFLEHLKQANDSLALK